MHCTYDVDCGHDGSIKTRKVKMLRMGQSTSIGVSCCCKEVLKVVLILVVAGVNIIDVNLVRKAIKKRLSVMAAVVTVE